MTFGGPGRDRTDDLFHAMEARSQLRHRPTLEGKCEFNSPPAVIDSQTIAITPAKETLRWAQDFGCGLPLPSVAHARKAPQLELQLLNL